MAGSSTGSGGGGSGSGGSGSGSHKKSSGGASGGGGGKNAAASAPTARKLSTKPLVATPLPAPLALEFSLADPALQTPQPLWLSWTAQRAAKQAVAAAAGAVYSDPEGLPVLPPSLASVCAGWRRLCDAAPYGAGVAEKGLLSVTPAEGFGTPHRAVPPAHHREGGWATVVAAMLNLILAKRKVLLGSDAAAAGGGGTAATGGSSGGASAAAAAAAAAASGPNFLWSHMQPAGKDGVVRWQPSGKYVLRVWHQCDWKLLVLDDQIPVDAAGRSLLPACSNPLELWPALLAKAMLKLWPGVELGSAQGTGGTEVLYSLCGWSTQNGVRAAEALTHPYPKANRPDGPVLPFNPLMEGGGGGGATVSNNTATTAPSTAASTIAAAPGPSSRARDSSSRGPTPSPSSGSSSSSAEKSSSNKKKPSSARKDSIELDSNSGEGGGGALAAAAAAAAAPPQPWSLEHTHAYASRRGELGWFNELVYAAPGSAAVPPAPPGALAAASASADGSAAAPVVPAQPPSGLLFAYAWAVVPDAAAADALLEGYPGLGQLLSLDPERVPVLGATASLSSAEFDAAAAAALVAGTPAVSSSSSASSASTSSSGTSSAPGSSHGRGRSGSVSSNLAAPAAAGAGAGPKSAAGKKGSSSSAATNAPAAPLPSTSSGSRIDAHLDDPAAAATAESAAAAAASGPRFLCMLVESFDEAAARLAFEHQARLAEEAALQSGLGAAGPPTGKKVSSNSTSSSGGGGGGGGGKSAGGGAKGAPGTPSGSGSSGNGGSGSGAGGSSSSKRASMGGTGGSAPPGTPGKGSSSAGAKDPQLASPQGSKPGTANAAAGGAGSKAGGSGASRSKLNKEEEAALRREEEQAAASLAAASRLAKQRAEESARASRSQARMDAWLRGEEALLEEEERAKTTPQLLLTDLLSGAVRVARVDSFAARFAQLQLVRDQARFDVVAPCVRDWWGGRELRRPFTSGAPAPLIFVPDLAPACAPLLPSIHAAAAAPTSANADGSEPSASAALRAYAAHAAREAAANAAVIRAARGRRIFLQVEFQTNTPSNGSATDAEPLPSIPSTAAVLRGAGGGAENGSVVSSPAGKNSKTLSGSGSSASKSRPISGGSAAAAKNRSAASAAGVANGGASPDAFGLGQGPLQPPAPLSAAHALRWSIAIERFDWATNRREVVFERSSGPGSSSPSSSEPPRRIECIEFTLPELDASAEVAGGPFASYTGASSAALSRPASSGSRKDKSGGGGSKKGDKSSDASSFSSGFGGFGGSGNGTGQPLSGALYRVVVSSNFGYALGAFSHVPFEMEEGKWGATGAALAAAAGEVVKEPSASGGGGGGSGGSGGGGGGAGKKGEVPSCHGSSALTTAGSASAPLLERVLPSTHVRCIEGSYPAQAAGAHWVLFKYVMEVTTPPMPPPPPPQASASTPQAALAASGSTAQILAPNSSGEFVIAEEVALAVDTRAGAGSRSARQSVSATTPKAAVSAADKKKAAASLAAAQAAEAEAAAQAALAHAAAEAAAIAAANPGAPAVYHKGMLPATAAQATESLSMSWLHPDKRAPGGTVCAPAAWKAKEGALGGAASAAAAAVDMWSTPLVPANHPQSTLISASLSLQDASLAPFVRLEWINNDTLDSWVVPLGGVVQSGPTMSFQPNTHGYTLVASAFLPAHAAFASKFFVRLLTSRPLLSFGVENLVAQQMCVDEYRSNTARNLCRIVVSGTTSAIVTPATAAAAGAGGGAGASGERAGTAGGGGSGGGGHGRSESLSSSSPACVSNLVPQSLLHFSTNLPRSGLVARVFDLDSSLESAWNAPPAPLAVVLGVQSLTVPVLLASRDARKLLVEISFAPLHPSAEDLAAFTATAHASAPPVADPAPPSKKESASAEKEKDKSVSLPPTGVYWCARFVSAQPLLLASDRAMEDELVALKASWAAGDSQRAKKARAAREAFLELRQAQLARAAAPTQLLQQQQESGSLPPLTAAPSVSRGEGGPTTPTSASSAATVAAGTSKKAAQQAEPLVLPPIPPAPVVVYASDTAAPVTIVLTDAMREERAAALAAEVDAARLFRLSLERQKDCLGEYVGRASLARDSALSAWRAGLEQRTHEAWGARADLRRSMIGHEAELAELRALVAQAPESATGTLVTVGNYDECNASHTPFNQMAVAPLAAANAPVLSAKDAAKEAKTAAAAAAAAAGSSAAGVGASPSSSASASRKKSGAGGAGAGPGLAEPSALESGRFGLASFLDAVEGALSGPASLPPWKGGSAVAHAVRRMQSVLLEALQTPLQHAALMHLQREQAPLQGDKPPAPGTPTAGAAGGAAGRKEKTALASVSKSAEGKAAAAAAEKTLADGSMLLPPLDRASMANALWHAVLNARNLLPKLSRPAALDTAAVQAEMVLLALSVEQLERAVEPLKYLGGGGGSGTTGSTYGSAASSPSGVSRSLADRSGDGEEKSNDDSLPSLRAQPPPASPVSASHRAAAGAGAAAGAKGQSKSSRAAAAAALAAAAAAAALPPQPDYAAIDAWSAQVRQYAHLIDLPVIAPHELHAYAPAAAPIVAPHVAAVGANSGGSSSSRPTSARVAPAPLPSLSPRTPADTFAIADAQWFGAGSERARAQAAAATGLFATDEKESSPPAFLSGPSLSSGAPAGPLQLPPAAHAPALPPSLDQAALSSCGANAAAALGRDTTVALLHSSLPASAGVGATAVAPRGGAGVPPGQCASAASAALSLSCCGLCFLAALQARASALTAVADEALVERRAEQARVQAVADAAAAAQAAATAAAVAAAHSDSGLPSKPSTAAPSHRKNASISTSNKKKSASLKKSKN